MNSYIINKSIKIGAILNFFGGLLVALGYVLHPSQMVPDTIGTNYWVIVHFLFLFSLPFGVFGFIAMLAHYSKSATSLGILGFFLGITSLIIIFGMNFFETLIAPVLAIEQAAFIDKYGAGLEIGLVAIIFPLGGLLFLLGYVLFYYDMLRAKSLPPFGIRVLIIGTIIFSIGLSGILPMIVVRIGSVAFGVGLMLVSISLFNKY